MYAVTILCWAGCWWSLGDAFAVSPLFHPLFVVRNNRPASWSYTTELSLAKGNKRSNEPRFESQAPNRTVLETVKGNQSDSSTLESTSPRDAEATKNTTASVRSIPENTPNATVAVSSSPPPPLRKIESSPSPTIPPPRVSSHKPTNVAKNWLYLQSIGAITGRGEFASASQKESVRTVVAALEAVNPTPEPAASPHLLGRWELVFTDTHLFRSSPFFMAARAVCVTDDAVQQFHWFCDMHRRALAISNIRAVRQIIGPTRLTSEFEVRAGAVPFLHDFTPWAYSGGWPITIDGSIVSTADWRLTTNATAASSSSNETNNAMEFYMDTVQIKGSNLPGLRQILDTGNVQLQSRELARWLENTVASYHTPRPVFATTYLDETLRISRDVDGHVFVYVKTSDDTTPTDYSPIDADLGVGRLLEGFNDAVTKFYL
ncbi:predicted protein [Phaeodactylum tricornutum CCAP 1055/1]|uniref:Plastid lipid-associated protein/fibrillin conserved domain-containing protein n=1 Tax=Phaeodactylum tricornutum (strain CCAP 1055/1) TaxID=556484 RepID=B7GCE0_PHATC|nr:predicted protein [Phaeodactylum tricornutum CCAP 1055/1]EEC43756.1 predicted protein [Phaeodactylum tricornutum CCAP 1055/1]|eukprot:XP_002184697.1 predicted protein [Phaeodactylum tricornutum CCAP 1055/1]